MNIGAALKNTMKICSMSQNFINAEISKKPNS